MCEYCYVDVCIHACGTVLVGWSSLGICLSYTECISFFSPAVDKYLTEAN